jgi:hypothetical protein
MLFYEIEYNGEKRYNTSRSYSYVDIKNTYRRWKDEISLNNQEMLKACFDRFLSLSDDRIITILIKNKVLPP